MKDNPFLNYRYVIDYDTEQKIDEQLIKDLLKEAIFTTPSKQNMMPYKIHVIGPGDKKIRQLLYNKSAGNEDYINEDRVKKQKVIYQYKNFFTAPYIFLFTQRLSNANPFFQKRLDRGFYYEAVSDLDKCRTTALIEIGMFAHNFGSLCLQNKIDVSHTRCIPSHDCWDEPEFYFLQHPVLLIMTIGKRKLTRRDTGIWFDLDYKPSFDEVVTFV